MAVDLPSGVSQQIVSTKLQHRAIKQVLLLSGSFVVFSFIYCYIYALLYPGSFHANFESVLSCVSQDWLVWLLITPFVAHAIFKKDLSGRSGQLSALALLITCTLMLGGARMLSEHLNGGEDWLHILLIYTPRYLVITALMVVIGLLYIFKGRTDTSDAQCRQLLQVLASHPRQEPEPLVVYKGSARKMILPQDIHVVRACGNYLELDTAEDCYLMRNTMKNIERQLCACGFVRIHRSHLVNIRAVDKVCGVKLEAHLCGGKVLKIGKKYLQELPHFRQTSAASG